ncbi:type VI secretion system contractile sheath large subunit [Serratia ureilytica]
MENLPCHTFPSDDGGVDMKCPTEIAISDRREAELAKTALCRWCTAKLRLRRLYRRAVAAEAGGILRCRRLRQRPAPRACRTCSPAAASRTT